MSQTQEDQNIETTNAGTITTSASAKTIAAGIKPEGWQITLPNPFYGMTLEQLSEAIGEDRVLDFAQQKLVITFQSAVRAAAEKGLSDEEIVAKMKDWRPGQRIQGSTTADLIKNFGNMTSEQQAALMARLQEMVK